MEGVSIKGNFLRVGGGGSKGRDGARARGHLPGGEARGVDRQTPMRRVSRDGFDLFQPASTTRSACKNYL